MSNELHSKNNEERDDSTSALDLLESLLDIDVASDTALNNSGKEEKTILSSSLIHEGDTDSSDDEDNRYSLEQKYNDCGRNIKKLINSETTPVGHLHTKSSSADHKTATWKTKRDGIPTQPLVSKSHADVYSDPVFGIRIINPLIGSRQLQEKMVGRKPVPMACVKVHIANGGTESDWVIAGVIVSKSPIKTSQKGSQYCIWRISDLKENLKTVSVFLFRNSHKHLWKTSVGTVIGILNPTVLEDRNDGDEATIAVDHYQKVMIMGMSKDYGICKSKKKNGENCTAFVNTNKCSYCIYHVQQEYKKCSRRSELQSPSLGRGLTALRNKVLGKNEVFYAGQSFSAVPALPNRKQIAKDNKRLMELRQSKLPASFTSGQVAANVKNVAKDKAILEGLKCKQSPEVSQKIPLEDSANRINAKVHLKESAEIDLSAPVNKFQVDRAKRTALAWVKAHGPLDKRNPNEVKKKNGEKRKFENENSPESEHKVPRLSNPAGDTSEKETSPKTAFSEKFLKLLGMKSKHVDLVDANDADAQEQYFNVLEKKEKMEEKMLNTFKVACKAVRCLKCRYTAFSASDMCKTQGHPLKVTDALKRFFRCRDCGNRTVTLELIPLFSCKQCSGSQWQRAPMMRERKGNNLQINPLSIRGGEETFLGSVQTNGNLNLMIPE